MDAKTEQELQDKITTLGWEIRCLKNDLRAVSKANEKKNEYITELEEKLGLTE